MSTIVKEKEQNEKKLQLEEKISKVSSEIFALPKERRHKNSKDAEFLTFKNKLAGDIWKWATITFPLEKVQNASCEIMSCIVRSLESFEGDGNYINYISSAVKKEIYRANEKQKVFEQRRISLPEKKARLIKNLLAYARLEGKDITNEEVIKTYAKCSPISEEKIRELVTAYCATQTVNEQKENDDGKITSIFDMIAKDYTSSESGFENDEIDSRLKQIDDMFCKQQERTKEYLSALLTRQALEEMTNANIGNTIAINFLAGRNFAITENAKRVIESFLNTEKIVTQGDIAKWFNRDKTDSSRTMREFLKKVKD